MKSKVKSLTMTVQDYTNMTELIKLCYKLYSYGVVSMYSTLDPDIAIPLFRKTFPQTDFNKLLIEGLKAAMKNNYFTFVEMVFKQMVGTAMSTAIRFLLSK